MTEKNYKDQILNCIPSVNTENDWNLGNAEEAQLLATAPAIPASKDLREQWWGIGNQEDTGSCVGWAVADSMLRWHFVKAGRISPETLLSPRFIWMASKETDEFMVPPTTFMERAGTSLKAALDIARKYGVVPDILLPFKSGRFYKGGIRTFYTIAAGMKIIRYFNLGRNCNDWKKWLVSTGPVLARVSVDATWDGASRTNGQLDVFRPDTVRGGHAVAIVGYTPDYFIIRNSWGPGWGNEGYAFASMEYVKSAITETYGINVL